MNKEIIYLIVIVYSLIFFAFISFELIKYIKFKIFIKRNDVISLLDGFYETSIYIVGSLYIALFLSSVIDMLMFLESYNNWKVSFVIYAMPLMVTTYRILISDALYSFNDERVFIGDNKYIDKNNIKDYKITKYNFINRAKIVLIPIENPTITYKKRYVVRTSINKLQQFLKLYQKD